MQGPGGIKDADVDAAVEAAQRISGALYSGNSRIHINAGGVGVWIAATCCAVMLATLLVGGTIAAVWISREFQRFDHQLSQANARINTQQAYINALYRNNPNLPKPEK